MRLKLLVLAAALTVSCSRSNSGAWENDFFSPVNKDEQYTQGLRFTSFDPANSSGNYNSYEAGQVFFTPKDKRVKELQKDDRPYAGWLFGGFNQHSKETSDQDTVAIKAGCIGPCSLAEKTQRGVHKIIDDLDPQGWDNQLGNEPTVMLSVDKVARKETVTYPLQADIITGAGIDVGTPFTQAAITGIARAGYNLPADFGARHILSRNFAPSLSREKQPWFGAYFFAATEHRAVAWNSFLDGNIFRNSHAVDSKPFVMEGRVGVSIRIWRVRFTYTYARISQEFEEREGHHGYGLVNFSWE